MNIAKKIQSIFEAATGLQLVYGTEEAINRAIGSAQLPCGLLKLMGTSNITTDGGMLTEEPRLSVAVVNLTQFDIDSYDNEDIIADCKAKLENFLLALMASRDLTLEAVTEVSRLYDHYDDIVTGIYATFRLREVVGVACPDGSAPVREIKITDNGTYNVEPYAVAIVDVQGGSPAVIEPLSVTPDYDPHTFTPSAGVDGFAPVEVAACPIPETDVLNVTPDNEPHQYLPEHGIGFSVVNVGACPVCPAPDVRPLSVVPSRSAQTFSPMGFDGFAPVEVQGYTPNLQSKTAEPATSAQVVTADGGYDGLSSVEVDAVTAAIDANITPENIKQGVEILGVTGTMEPMPEGDRIVLCNTQTGVEIGEYVSETQLTATAEGDFSQQLVEVQCNAVATVGTRTFPSQLTNLKKVIMPSVTTVANSAFMTGASQSVEVIEFGQLVSINAQYTYVATTNLRIFGIGEGTAINIPLGRWTAANVIAEGQSGIDELNYNIKTYIADRVADRTGLAALTVTFGASLYNVLTAATIAAFTAKNWNVASA